MVRKSSAQQRMLDREAQKAKDVAEEEKGPQEAAQEPYEAILDGNECPATVYEAPVVVNPTIPTSSDSESEGTFVPPNIVDGLEAMLEEHEESKLTPRQQMLRDREQPETD